MTTQDDVSTELARIRDQITVIKSELSYIERQIQLLIVHHNYSKIEPDANRIDTLGANY